VTPRPARGAAAWIAALALCGSACSPGAGVTAQEAGAVCEMAVPVAVLPASLGEASGLTRDPRRPDLFWLHNDSGNEPLLFAVDTTGALLSTVRVTGASDRDPEDIALGRCGEGWCLHLGDIGDNSGVYPSVRVHRLPLPELPAAGCSVPGDAASGDAEGGSAPPPGSCDQVIAPLASWELVYPDGPRDAEGLVVDDVHGELLVVSKGREGRVQLYSVPLADLETAAGATVTLRRVGSLAIPVGLHTSQLVTAADLSPDGRRLAIRSYVNLYLLNWRGSAAQDTSEAPAVAPLLPAFEPQGEGLSWAADGITLYLASEGRDGRPPQLSRIRCPGP
jgi:hypothetical protein